MEGNRLGSDWDEMPRTEATIELHIATTKLWGCGFPFWTNLRLEDGEWYENERWEISHLYSVFGTSWISSTLKLLHRKNRKSQIYEERGYYVTQQEPIQKLFLYLKGERNRSRQKRRDLFQKGHTYHCQSRISKPRSRICKKERCH